MAFIARRGHGKTAGAAVYGCKSVCTRRLLRDSVRRWRRGENTPPPPIATSRHRPRIRSDIRFPPAGRRRIRFPIWDESGVRTSRASSVSTSFFVIGHIFFDGRCDKHERAPNREFSRDRRGRSRSTGTARRSDRTNAVRYGRRTRESSPGSGNDMTCRSRATNAAAVVRTARRGAGVRTSGNEPIGGGRGRGSLGDAIFPNK